jgi:quinol monooxygenase YgiN
MRTWSRFVFRTTLLLVRNQRPAARLCIPRAALALREFAIVSLSISSQVPKMVYVIVCHLYAKEGSAVEGKIHDKLVEASKVYVKDAEVIGYHVMQDHEDPRKWCIVERYERESVRVNRRADGVMPYLGLIIFLLQSLKIHQANPFYNEFMEYMKPLVAGELEIHQLNELE